MIYMKLLLGSVVLARAAASTVCTEQFSDEAKLAYCEGLAAGKWGFNRLQEHFWYKHADEVEACFGDDVTEFQGGTVPDCAAITSTRKLSHTDGKAAEKLMNNLMPRLRATGQKHRETEQRRRLGTDDFVKAEGNGYATCEDSKNFYDVTSGVFENAEELFLATTSGPNGYCRDSCIRDDIDDSGIPPSLGGTGKWVFDIVSQAAPCNCDIHCDAFDDCCVDFCEECAGVTNGDDESGNYGKPVTCVGDDCGQDPFAVYFAAGDDEYGDGDPEDFGVYVFRPLAPLCLAPTPRLTQAPVGVQEETCNDPVDGFSFATTDTALTNIRFAADELDNGFLGGETEDGGAARYGGEDIEFSDDGRVLQWQMSVDSSLGAAFPFGGLDTLWRDYVGSIQPVPVTDCFDDVDLNPDTDPVNGDDCRYVENDIPCDWQDYIANGYIELPKCDVGPRNARHVKATDMAMQYQQKCCRDCAKLDAVMYARTAILADADGEYDIRFVGNDGAKVWLDSGSGPELVIDESICSAAKPGLATEFTLNLTEGYNVLKIKVSNHGIQMREMNHGFLLKFRDTTGLSVDKDYFPDGSGNSPPLLCEDGPVAGPVVRK